MTTPITFSSHPVDVLASLVPDADPARLAELRAICDKVLEPTGCPECGAKSMRCFGCSTAVQVLELADVFHLSSKCNRCGTISDEACKVRAATTEEDEAAARVAAEARDAELKA